ncbi:MAG: hypothetical protein Greene041619_329 [Candidatus Peregrinibacteria bacterium Greene0416_19]|nr:MAG: hypothetical protein Greene041619_329 [Candidatus Peregrinibacteria bacterium Greene0416_19]
MPRTSKNTAKTAGGRAGVRSRNLFDALDAKPFRLSRSKIELFLECPRCFYLDRTLGIDRPDGPPFTLNSAVDALLKKEFDIHRKNGEPHPLMTQYTLPLVPFDHPELDTWRENFKGVQYLHASTNLLICGAVDDIWVDDSGKLFVVDYKATSSGKEISEATLRGSYRRQMEMYQWLLRRNGFTVSDTGYFVYVNADRDRAAFDGKLEFSAQIISYAGSDDWVEQAISDAHACLCRSNAPGTGAECDWCRYREAARKVNV